MAKKKRNEDLQLTLFEKVGLLYGKGNWHLRGVPRIGLKGIELHDGPFGLVKFPDGKDLGEAQSEPSIVFPGPCALASSFDEMLMREVGETMGRICRDHDTQMLLAPGINIKRNPLCGRNFEYYSEDPLVSGKMAAAFISGIQSQGVGACIKHFACNSQESFRMVNDSIVDRRALHEIYLKGFEIAIKESHPWAVMSSYNRINGDYASDSDYLLREVLKGRWGFDGVVMSDWGGTNDYIDSHNHGLDIEMPCHRSRRNELRVAVKRGLLSKERVDESAERVVRLLRRCHEKTRYERCFDQEAHDLAIRAAAESCVLLKNDGILPLKSLKQTSIVGELARTPNFQGGGSSKATPHHIDTFYESAINWNGSSAVFFAPGYRLDGVNGGEDLTIDAVDVAARGGRVILFMGLTKAEESEGYDRTSLHLPDEQISLFNQIYEVNQNIIVVLMTGAPVELPFRDKARAILQAYLPGEGGGEAIYRILMGSVNPSGRLAETWPEKAYDMPSFGFYPGTERVSLYRESIYVGYRYYLTAKKAVNYPFGYGLSYSRFKYGAPVLSAPTISKHETIDVAVNVENVSQIPGKTVVQIYQEAPKGKAFKALRTLLGFQKVFLEAGEKKTVHFQIRHEDFAHYELSVNDFRVEEGDYQIEVCEDCQTVRGSAALKVVSEDEIVSCRSQCPIYYILPEDGFLSYDNDFERLLGHLIPVEKDHDSRPYNMNSTIGNIRRTFIGKRILQAASSRFKDVPDPERKMLERSVMELPLRNLGMVGVSPKVIQAVLDMANGSRFKALWHLIFPKPRKRR